MNNPYVYRASRIHSTFCAGQGYTTEIVPRGEEEIPDEQLDNWQKTTSIYVPYWNKEMTPEQILDKTFGDVEGYDDMVVEKNISVFVSFVDYKLGIC